MNERQLILHLLRYVPPPRVSWLVTLPKLQADSTTEQGGFMPCGSRRTRKNPLNVGADSDQGAD